MGKCGPLFSPRPRRSAAQRSPGDRESNKQSRESPPACLPACLPGLQAYRVFSTMLVPVPRCRLEEHGAECGFRDVEESREEVDLAEVDFTTAPTQSSPKEMLTTALEHYKANKWKYMSCKILVAAAIILGCVYGILLTGAKSKPSKASLQLAILAGKVGSTIPSVSGIPAKAKASSTRRLSAVVNPTALFDALSDYGLFGNTRLVVQDTSLSQLDFINMMSCVSQQLRGFDVGMNSSFNPNALPYVAVVDTSTCGMNGLANFYVKTTGPRGGGDGEYHAAYTSAAQFSGNKPLNFELTNTVVNSALTSSKLTLSCEFFNVALILDVSNPSQSEINLVSKTEGDANPYTLHAIFNPATFVGSAISQSNGVTYNVKTSAAAIKRRATKSDGSFKTSCLDYSSANMLYSAEQYTLFNANDGSRVKQTSYYLATYTPALLPDVNVLMVFTFNGASANDVTNDDGTTKKVTYNSQEYSLTRDLFISDTSPFAIKSGDSVSVLLEDGTQANLKVAKVNSLLMKIQNVKMTLDDIQDLPLVLSTNLVISWDGTKFVKVGQQASRCMSKSIPLTVDPSIDLTSTDTGPFPCSCLDTSGSMPTNGYQLKASGSFNSDTYVQRYTQKLDGTSQFIPDSSAYSQGMRFRVARNNGGFLDGTVLLPLDKVIKLHGVVSRQYLAGTVIKQPSTGATGVVYKSSSPSITGVNVQTATFTGYISGASSGTATMTVTGGVVYLGLSYAPPQGSSVDIKSQTSGTMNGAGTYTITCSTCSNAGSQTPITYTGSYVVTYNSRSDDLDKSCDWPGILFASNYLNPGVKVTQGSAVGFVTDTWNGAPTSALSLTVESGSFSATGGSLIFSIGKSVAYSWSFYGFSGTSTLTNQASVSDVSSKVTVTLTSTVYFESGNKELFLADGTLIGNYVSAESAYGDIGPIPSATTIVTFTIATNVQANDQVPSELWCGMKCPKGRGASYNSKLPTYSIPSAVTGVFVYGSCLPTFCPTTATFTNFKPGFNPTLTFSCDETTGQISAALISSGQTDVFGLGAPQGTATGFAAGKCGRACTQTSCYAGDPVIIFNYQPYADATDLGQASKYSFDPVSGILTDKTDSNSPQIVASTTNDQYSYFFEPSASTKAALACPFDNTIICYWNANTVSCSPHLCLACFLYPPNTYRCSSLAPRPTLARHLIRAFRWRGPRQD